MFYPFLFISVTHDLSYVGRMFGLLSSTTLVLFWQKNRMVKHFIVRSEDRADLQI